MEGPRWLCLVKLAQLLDCLPNHNASREHPACLVGVLRGTDSPCCEWVSPTILRILERNFGLYA